MKVVLTAEQQEFREMLRHLFTAACPPSVVREAKAGRQPEEPWRTLANNQLFGLAVPAEYGGDGAGLFELGLLFEQAGRVLCPTEVYSTLIAGVALAHVGMDDQRRRYLPALAAGELHATTAMWNASDAADVRPAFVAKERDPNWLLSGAAMFVADAERADVVLLTASTNEPGRVAAAVIERGTPGWAATPLTTLAGQPLARVQLTGLLASSVVPVAIRDLRWVANAALALQCMEMVGGASAVIDRTVAHVKAREQFGRPLASFQAVHHHVANMRIALDNARLTAWHAAWLVGHGDLAQRTVAIAKMHCSEAYKSITLNAHQLHGGIGFVRETDLHLWSERAKVAEIQGGTSDIAARWLASELDLVQE